MLHIFFSEENDVNVSLTDCNEFEDYTSNFIDLGFWETAKDLHGKTVKEIRESIRLALKIIRDMGYEAYKPSDEDITTRNGWLFGHTEPAPGCGLRSYGKDYFNLPKKDRVEILIFHLTNLLEDLEEIPSTYYGFLTMFRDDF